MTPRVLHASRWGMVALVLLMSLDVPAMPARAQPITVTATTVADLINDINTANGTSGASTIINLIAGTTYTLTAETSVGSGTGLPIITGDLTINGNGATIARSAANGTPNFRLFIITGSGALHLSGVTIRNGRVVGQAGSNGGNGRTGRPIRAARATPVETPAAARL